MQSNTLVFVYPHQLFYPHPLLEEYDDFWIIEDPLFFRDKVYGTTKFHKQKLLYHRMTMKTYEAYLIAQNKKVRYIEYKEISTLDTIFKFAQEAKTLRIIEPEDFILKKRIQKYTKKMKIEVIFSPSPNFLTPKGVYLDIFKNKTSYYFTTFYIAQRKRLEIMLTATGDAIGGKWSYDPENRKKLPKDHVPPKLYKPEPSIYLAESKAYIETYFSDHPGSMDICMYPTTPDEVKNVLIDFLNNRFEYYGAYQDAINDTYPFVYHSLLTPALNAGIITPKEIIDKTLEFAEHNEVPLNSLEGFIRQIIGWREYIRAMYHMIGTEQRTTNYFKHTRKLTHHWYDGSTGITPVDDVIKKLNKYAYSHHIERLMIIGNFMLLCEIDPDEVYRWFMEMHIDSYDWVMVPNVYGMSQYADGGKIVTKPYISSSNYIRKMSSYKRDDWCDIWDGLYWKFIDTHQELFRKNPRMGMMVNLLKKMKPEKKTHHFKQAEAFLAKLDS